MAHLLDKGMKDWCVAGAGLLHTNKQCEVFKQNKLVEYFYEEI
jgi:hypothetical protein